MVRLDLLGAYDNDFPVVVELREIVFKLVWPEIPSAIFAFSLDLEILIDQATLFTKLKRSSTSLVEEKFGTLSQQ